ncbi:unnamed protein product [Amoebophrya sp. A120]|nr:unnamed protein product [Amoebophrya sp. A120]|eukprot:GSA120T00021406001.1
MWSTCCNFYVHACSLIFLLHVEPISRCALASQNLLVTTEHLGRKMSRSSTKVRNEATKLLLRGGLERRTPTRKIAKNYDAGSLTTDTEVHAGMFRADETIRSSSVLSTGEETEASASVSPSRPLPTPSSHSEGIKTAAGTNGGGNIAQRMRQLFADNPANFGPLPEGETNPCLDPDGLEVPIVIRNGYSTLAGSPWNGNKTDRQAEASQHPDDYRVCFGGSADDPVIGNFFLPQAVNEVMQITLRHRDGEISCGGPFGSEFCNRDRWGSSRNGAISPWLVTGDNNNYAEAPFKASQTQMSLDGWDDADATILHSTPEDPARSSAAGSFRYHTVQSRDQLPGVAISKKTGAEYKIWAVQRNGYEDPDLSFRDESNTLEDIQFREKHAAHRTGKYRIVHGESFFNMGAADGMKDHNIGVTCATVIACKIFTTTSTTTSRQAAQAAPLREDLLKHASYVPLEEDPNPIPSGTTAVVEEAAGRSSTATTTSTSLTTGMPSGDTATESTTVPPSEGRDSISSTALLGEDGGVDAAVFPSKPATTERNKNDTAVDVVALELNVRIAAAAGTRADVIERVREALRPAMDAGIAAEGAVSTAAEGVANVVEFGDTVSLQKALSTAVALAENVAVVSSSSVLEQDGDGLLAERGKGSEIAP